MTNLKNKILAHISLAVVTAFFLFIFFRDIIARFANEDNEMIALAFTVCFLGGIYLGRFISGLFAKSHKSVQNGILISLPFIIFFSIALINIVTNKLFGPNASDRRFYPPKIVLLFSVFFMMSIAIGMLIKMVRVRIKNQLQLAQADAAYSKSELQLLQSQLSPHFLFNTLNNLYGISLNAHEKTPPLLLKLSELLRYTVYDAKETLVPLCDEIAYLKNYIEFETLRIGDRLELHIDLEEGETQAAKIAPMLLIVFVENAFKHSKNSPHQKIYIDLSLKVWRDSIFFSLRNSHFREENEVAVERRDKGVGLDNVRKRLQLLYPNAHDLKINESPERFDVMMRVNKR